MGSAEHLGGSQMGHMNSTDFLLALLVAVICGTIAQLTSGYSKGGWIVNLIIGFLGALAGVVVSRLLNAPVIYDLIYKQEQISCHLLCYRLRIFPGRHRIFCETRKKITENKSDSASDQD